MDCVPIIVSFLRNDMMGKFSEPNYQRNCFSPMATYYELKVQAEALARRAEEARLAELERIITSIREQVA